MNWQNLERNKCPQCGKDFMDGLMTERAFKKLKPVQVEDYIPSLLKPVELIDNTEQLLLHPCGFRIREKRYSEIVNDQVNQKIEEEDDI